MHAHEDAQPAKPRLLFITPAFPDTRGNGLAMRAGMWLEALARRYRVALLVVPFVAPSTPAAEAFARAHAESIGVVPPAPPHRRRWLRPFHRGTSQPELMRLFAAQTRACVEALRGLDGADEIEVIHTFRLYTTPVALALRDRMPAARLHLDLDDIESLTHERLATMRQSHRDGDGAAEAAEETRRFAAAERDLIPRFDRVYVCSPLDAERLRALVPASPEVRVVPNAVRPPPSAPARRTTRPFTFLFVGTLGYEPNADAIEWFCRRVLPRIHARAGRPVLVRIVGRILPGDLAGLARLKGVRLAGEVSDIAPEYGDAGAVIIPLRAGGGTRIKVLEAFAHCRPVVSTSLGIEGIEAVPDHDLLVADDPEAFAAACLRLMDDPALGAGLAKSAARLVKARYSQEVVNAQISEAT